MSSRLVCICLFAVFSFTQAIGQLQLDGVSNTPYGYFPDSTFTLEVTLEVSDPSEFEFVDYLVLGFPAGWQVTPTADFDLSEFETLCGEQVVSGSGTNVFTVGTNDPMGAPNPGSGCGVIEPGTYIIPLEVTVPAGTSGDQSVSIDIYGDGFLQTVPTEINSSFMLFEIMCIYTCPPDVVVYAEADMCGANVNIPAPGFTGNCSPAPAAITGFYPVGTTEVIVEADNANPNGPISCSFEITVIDTFAPVIEPIDDMVFDLDGGECIQVVSYSVEAEDDCGGMLATLTQNTDPETIVDGVACPAGPSTFSRVFDLEAMGQYTDFTVSTIEIGVVQSFDSPDLEIRVWELDGALDYDNMTLVYESTEVIPDLFFEMYDLPVDFTMEVDKEYVVQLHVPGSIFNGFIIGYNTAGETGTSFVESAFCSAPPFTDASTLGAGDVNIIMNLEGTGEPFDVEVVEGLESDSPFPIGTTTNVIVVTDQSGNTDTLTFDVTVNNFPDAISNLACNNVVNISLGEDCEAVITPDMVLEGGPYSCYDDYEVVIIDEFGNEFFGSVSGVDVGQTLSVEVRDSSGNSCAGQIFIEDKLPPVLECTTRTTQCNASSFDPLAALPPRIRFQYDDLTNNIISDTDPSTMLIPLEVEGLNNANITDLNIDIDVSHTFLSDLILSIISPEGTEVVLMAGLICFGEDLNVTFDNSASVNIVDTCSVNIPAIEGTFMPEGNLADFLGEDPNGTWMLRVSDFAAGDGGSVNNIELEISQNGGFIGMPLPEDAIAIPTGNNTFNVLGLDPCGEVELMYTDVKENMDCSSPFTHVIYRTYTGVDESGNVAVSCTDTINVLRTDLSTLTFPPNYDDIQNNALSCTSGYPTPDVTGRPTGDFCENVEISYDDSDQIFICEGSYKILRKWTVYEWCSSDVIEHVQIIKVSDEVGPNISVPSVDQVSTSPSSCDGSLLLPQPSIVDNCTSVPTYTVEADAGYITQQGQNFFLNGLEIGTVTVTYTAYDDCGNTSTDEITIDVADKVSPVAICDQHTTVSLSFEETVTVDALTFDDGSYDECTDVEFAVRRMTDNCGIAGNTNFASSAVFCCSDVEQTVMVEFRVTDENGNSNTCMVEVTVDDKIAPALQAPADVTLDCQDDYTDLNLTGGLAIGFDNCELNEVTFTDFVSIGSCGSGQVTRVFTVTDKSGLSASDTQVIYLINNDLFNSNDITFPQNRTLFSCDDSTDPDNTGKPLIQDDACSQVSYTYWDDVFEIADGACLLIYRKWSVIDQCQYNALTGVGLWEDIQVIEVVNNVAPEFTGTCTDVTIDAFGSCNGDVSLEVEATDDCTDEEDLTYSWRIDEFNTGDLNYEYEGEGNTMSGNFPVGTHRIIWTVLDNCGNNDVCDYLFTVRDAKKPTPYCISTLSTAVMNTTGEVEIWASDFDLGATDNCTAPEDLIISFTENGFTPARTFSCADITSGVSQLIDDINIWVTDEAGNKDFCTVSLLLEDNEANICDDLSSITVGGAIENTHGDKISDVTLKATNEIGQEFDQFNFTNEGYSFDLLPSMDYTITAEKLTDPLNGITIIDIVLIQKHILALTTFDSPYKTIAADADNNHKINGLDIIQIRKLLLGYNDNFINDQKPWRFVKKEQEFSTNFDVFPYEESIEINFSGNMMNNDFVGVKIGDINGSADPANLISDLDTRTNKSLDFVIDNQSFTEGETIEIPVYASNFEHIFGYQMTLEYKPSIIELIDVIPGQLEMREANVNMAFAQNGYISAVWNSVDAVSADEVLFTLVATAKRDGSLANMFSTSDRLTRTLSYASLDEAGDVTFELRNGTNVSDLSETLIHSVSPNPFSDYTIINFELPTTEEVQIQVYDMEGKQVLAIEQGFAAGSNSYELNSSMLNGSGVYYYTIITSKDSASGRVILID